MTRLDRYVLSVFIPAVVIFGAAVVSMAMLVDFILRGADFLRLKHESALRFAMDYYVMRLPLFIRMTLPTVPLFAAAFTVVRLGRTNELVPIAAAGMSLRRIYAPFLIFAGLCAAVIAGLEQWVLPPLMPEIAETEALLSAKERSYAVILSDPRGNFLYAPQYDHPKRTMKGDWDKTRKEYNHIMLIQIPPGGTLRRIFRAETGQWDEHRGGWTFFGGTYQDYVDGVRPEQPREAHRRPEVSDTPIPAEGIFVPSDILPSMIRRGADLAGKFGDFHATREAARRHPEIPELATRLIDKFTYPVSALLMLMLGLPFVTDLQQKTQVKGMVLSLAVCAAYFIVYLVGQDYANRQLAPAAVGCWGPTVIFGCLGAGLYGMIRT